MQLFDIQQHPHLVHDIQVEQASQRVIRAMVVAYLQAVSLDEVSYPDFLNVFNLCIRRSHSFKLKLLEQAGVDTQAIESIFQQLEEYDQLAEHCQLPKMIKWRQGHTSPVSAAAMTSLNFHKSAILRNPQIPDFVNQYFQLLQQLLDEPGLPNSQVWRIYLETFSEGFPDYFNAKTLANSLYILRPDVFPLINDYVLGDLQRLLKTKVELSAEGYCAAAAELEVMMNKITGGTSQHFGILDRVMSYQVEYPEALDGEGQSYQASAQFVPTTDVPDNVIFYGPPGTGKTYHTVTRAIKILDPECYTHYEANPCEHTRRIVKKRFDELVEAGRISMATFHQSFAYEDFVEGLRAEALQDESESQSGIYYEVQNGVFKTLCQSAQIEGQQPFVLIIDEINRGNISRIFGELITLLESSKREGAEDQQTVTLPYSKQAFSVPANVYVIGTMNTADRSLAQLDIALRRRFEFEEMLPEPELLAGIEIEGINLGRLLQVMNERIEVLLGRDYMLGHSYLMALDSDSALADLAEVFQKRILPLLQEYFFADWEKIRLVLNDHRKALEHQLVTRPDSGHSLTALFGDRVEEPMDRRYSIQQAAFGHVESFAQIIPDDLL